MCALRAVRPAGCRAGVAVAALCRHPQPRQLRAAHDAAAAGAEPLVLCSVTDRVATITLNDPKRLNALTGQVQPTVQQPQRP